MASKLLNLFALSTLAVLLTSFGPVPAQALTTNHDVLRRHAAHDVIAKQQQQKKRANNSKRCKTRSSSALSTTPTPQPTSSSSAPAPPPAPTSSQKAQQAPAPAAPTAQQASTQNSGSGSNAAASGGKVGLAWANGFMNNLPAYKTDQTNMLYTWSPSCPSNTKSAGFKCVPMLWGWNQQAEFEKTVVQGYSDVLLAINEPNEPGQSNMSPQSAAQLWQQSVQPLKAKGYRLGSPATSSNPNGLQWMKDFMAACEGCTIDFIAVHWYDVSPQAFIDYVNLWHNTFNKPIWVTEWACQNFNGGAQCTQDEVWNMMSTVTKFMQETPWVEQYFAFGIMHDMQGVNSDNQLMDTSGNPNALGSFYIKGSQ